MIHEPSYIADEARRALEMIRLEPSVRRKRRIAYSVMVQVWQCTDRDTGLWVLYFLMRALEEVW